jgi:phage I-like protein
MHPKPVEALLEAVDAFAHHSVVLSLDVLPKDGKAPKELRILRSGENDSTKGKFLFSQRSADLVMSQAKDWGNRFHFDWDHQAALASKGSGRAPAAAWYALEVRNGELWATGIEWTNAGRTDVEERNYAYLSPWFDFDEETREVTRFNNAALTNLPALKQLEALASMTTPDTSTSTPPTQKHEEPTMDKKALLTALSLPENTTDAELAAKVAELKSFKQQTLSATGATNDMEAMTALLSAKGSATEIEALKKSIESHKAEGVKKERDALLSAAIAEGKLEPGSDLRKQLEGQSVETVKALLSALPGKKSVEANPPKGEDANAGAGTTGSAALSKEQQSAAGKTATWFGHKAEDVEKRHRELIQEQQNR